MDIESRISPFRFIASHITDLHIDNTYIKLDDSTKCKRMNVSHKVLEIIEQDDSWIGIIELSIKVNITEEENDSDNAVSQKYVLDMKMEGAFTTSKDMSKTDFKDMLSINGYAALYSIARGFIISTSSQTLAGGQIVLPLLNFT